MSLSMHRFLFIAAFSCITSFFGEEQETLSHSHFGKEKPPPEKSQPLPPLPFDADLFRRATQVLSFHGEFLFWRVQEGSLDYAMTMRNSAWGPTNSYAQG